MALVSQPRLGDVEVATLNSLKPGLCVLLWYSDDDVWHEAVLLYLVR